MSPAFDSQKVQVVFVLGGPGAGKGTQCSRLVAEYGFVHLSAGDLLRIEQQREGSDYADVIQSHIKEGKIVPMEIILKLMEESIRQSVQQGNTKFLIDGFPRKMDQAIKFDSEICESFFVLFLTCPEEKLLPRLIERGKTSGREDDNEESIKKRFRTFIETSMPVVDYYSSKGKVVQIDSSGTVDEIYNEIKIAMEARMIPPASNLHTSLPTSEKVPTAAESESESSSTQTPDRAVRPRVAGETPKPRS